MPLSSSSCCRSLLLLSLLPLTWVCPRCAVACSLAAAHQPAAEERRRSSTAASTRGSSGSTSTSPSSSASNGTSPSTSTSASTSSTGSSSGPTVASVAERLLHPSGGAHPDPTRPSRNTAVDHQYQWFLDEWDKGFVEGREEAEGYFLECIQGSVPADLTGTLFRCARCARAKPGSAAARLAVRAGSAGAGGSDRGWRAL